MYDEELAVRGIVEEYFRTEDPARLEEVEDVFDLVYSMIDDRIGEPKAAGDRSFEGLAADPSFFSGAAVASAIWVATLLYRQARDRDRKPEERLEAILAELTGNPEMIRRLRERIHLLTGLDRHAAGEGGAPVVRDVGRLPADPAADFAPASGLPEAPPATAILRASAASAVSPEPDLSLFVTTQDDLSGRLRFSLRAKDPALELVYTELGSTTFGPALRAYVGELTVEVRRLHDYANRAEARMRIERLGERLAEQLVPDRLLQALDRVRGRAESLIVYSETFIPWELLRFPDRPGKKGAFWAEAFAITRWFTGAPEVFDLPLRNIALIAPASGLAAAGVEAREVLALAQGGRQVVRLEARRRVLTERLFPSTFDTLHFAGHGMVSPSSNPDFGHLLLDGEEKLDSIDVPRRSLLAARPLVFLNACHSGQGGPLPTGIGGLAKAFVDAGAAAVVGCHWAISDRLAETFASELYRLLLSGVPLAEAGRRARLHLRDQSAGDPTWIAYTLFGQPNASCPPPDPEPQGAGS